jgi:hypothetical protein
MALSACSTIDEVFGDDTNEPDRDPSGVVTARADDADIFSLEVGDCISAFDAGEVASVSVIPCTDSHEMEIFARFQIDEDEFPGDEETGTIANDGCVEEFEAFIGVPYNQSELFVSYLYPNEDTWGNGDREVLCTVYELGDNDKPLEVTGSLQGTSR